MEKTEVGLDLLDFLKFLPLASDETILLLFPAEKIGETEKRFRSAEKLGVLLAE